MILKIFQKELLLNIMTFKYIIGTFMCAFLVILLLPVLINDYEKRIEIYNNNVSNTDAELAKVKCYKSLTPTVYRRPAVLSIFSRGIENQIADSSGITLTEIPIIRSSSVRANPYLSIFPDLDVSLIIKVVVSLIAILMAYDAISGERENGTLKVILSNTVSRSKIIIGKYLAGMISLTISLLIAYVTVILILLLYPLVELKGSDWCRIVLMYLASALFVSVMYNVGLFFSCITKKSSTSLISGIILWAIFLFIVPNLSRHLSDFIFPLDSNQTVDEQIGVLDTDYEHNFKDASGILKYPIWGGIDAFGGFCYDLCSSQASDILRDAFVHNEPLRIKYAQDVWKVKDNRLKELDQQRSLSENISKLSPMCVFEDIMNAITNTDYQSCRLHTDRVADYRDIVINYLINKTDNFKSTVYFTPGQPEAERKQFWKTEERRKEHFDNLPALNLDDFPKFVYMPRTLIHSLRTAMFDFTILILINSMFFSLSYLSFIKCDVR